MFCCPLCLLCVLSWHECVKTNVTGFLPMGVDTPVEGRRWADRCSWLCYVVNKVSLGKLCASLLRISSCTVRAWAGYTEWPWLLRPLLICHVCEPMMIQICVPTGFTEIKKSYSFDAFFLVIIMINFTGQGQCLAFNISVVLFGCVLSCLVQCWNIDDDTCSVSQIVCFAKVVETDTWWLFSAGYKNQC